MMALLMFAIKGKQKHSDQESPIVACSPLLDGNNGLL